MTDRECEHGDEMIDTFKHYWQISEAEKKDVLEKGVIVLDANIYLNVYRLHTEKRDHLLQILKDSRILKRLWVPHQVAEEVFRNRLSIIGDQKASVKKFLDTATNSLKEMFSKMDIIVRKHHPLIDRERW